MPRHTLTNLTRVLSFRQKQKWNNEMTILVVVNFTNFHPSGVNENLRAQIQKFNGEIQIIDQITAT